MASLEGFPWPCRMAGHFLQGQTLHRIKITIGKSAGTVVANFMLSTWRGHGVAGQLVRYYFWVCLEERSIQWADGVMQIAHPWVSGPWLILHAPKLDKKAEREEFSLSAYGWAGAYLPLTPGTWTTAYTISPAGPWALGLRQELRPSVPLVLRPLGLD